MNTICISDRQKYTSEGTVFIVPNDYPCVSNESDINALVRNPHLLPINVKRHTPYLFTIDIGDPMLTFNIMIDPKTNTINSDNGNTGLVVSTNINNRIQFNCPNTIIAFSIILEQNVSYFVQNDVLYREGDVYVLYLNVCDVTNGIPDIFVVSQFTRNPNAKIIRREINMPDIPVMSSLLNKELIQVPALDIIGQTLIDGSDVGNMIFTIRDTRPYYNHVSRKFCDTYYIDPNELKETIFNKKCPRMVTVFKGNADLLVLKVAHVYDSAINGPDFMEFYENIIFYGMLKYILSKILYGKFNINYLLEIYNDKFLDDLQSSQFCRYSPFFTDPISPIYNFNKYFKYTL